MLGASRGQKAISREVTRQTWTRRSRWTALACVLLFTATWLSPALAAGPPWWDCNYQFRKQITVTTGSSAAPTGSSVLLTFDHAALFSAGKSQADGDDIRVVYWNGSAWVELARSLDSGSSWGSASTKIWFKTQAAIGASSSDGNYYLYYGNPTAANPPATPQNGGGVKSLQTGSQAMGTTPTTVTITAVDPSKSFVICTWRATVSNHYQDLPTCELTGSTSLVIRTGGASSSTVVNWQVVEFSSGVTVQRGLSSFGSSDATKNVGISSVDTGKTFVLVTRRTTNTASGVDNRFNVRARLTSATNLELSRNADGSTVDVAWQVIQMDSASVQSGLTTISSGTTATATISSVDTAKTFVVLSAQATDTPNEGDEEEFLVRGTVTNSTTLTFIRNGTTNTLDISWFAVTMTDGSSVQKGTASGGTQGTVNVTISAIDTASTVSFISSDGGSGGSATHYDESVWTSTFTTTTNLQLQRGTAASVGTDIDWFVLQFSGSGPSASLGSEETATTSVTAFTPDAAAPGMNVPVTFLGGICTMPTVTTSSSDIVVGPSIMTDSTGAVVSSNGSVLSTMFFVKPSARPATGITVSVNGTPLTQTFDIVMPAPDPNGVTPLSGRTKRGTKVLGGLTVGSGQTLTISTSDTDGGTAGNQGFLPAVILVKGDVNIAGTLDVKGQNGTSGGSDCSGGEGGVGGPGGGGGGGGGVKDASCGGGGGSIAVDAVSSGTVEPQGESSKTISHTTTSGSDRLMIVGISFNNQNGQSVSSVTYAGQALTKLADATISNDARAELWYRVAPSTGTNNVVLNFSAGLQDGGVVGVITFTGVDQSSPFGTHATATGDVTSATVNVSSASGELVFGVFASESASQDGGASSATVGPGQTEHWNLRSVIHDSTIGAGSTEPGASTVTISWTLDAADDWAIVAVPIKPSGSGGGGSTAASGGAGHSGGGGGGSKGSGAGGAGGSGTGAAGAAASGTTGGAGGIALASATGGGGGMANTQVSGGDGGGGGTGNPFGAGGSGASTDGAAGGQGGGGGGASDTTPGGGGGGGFGAAGTRGSADADAGYEGAVNGNAQLIPLMGGSGGAGGAPDTTFTSANRGGGGGGGGGTVLIYATGSVTVTGTITAAGGNGGSGYTFGTDGSGGGGGGSGGAIFLQSGTVTASGTLTTPGGTAGTSNGSAAGGAGGSGRIRIDGLSSGSNISGITGAAGSRFIGPVIDTLVGTTVTGRADGGSSVTLYVYDENGAQVTGSPYSTSASGSSGSVGTWTVSNVTFPSGTAYLAVKQTTGSVQVFGPGRGTKGLQIINWREVY